MGEREIGLGIGDRLDGYEVVAAVPHTTRDRTWIVVGRRHGVYASFAAGRPALDALPVKVEVPTHFTDVADALADMLHRART